MTDQREEQDIQREKGTATRQRKWERRQEQKRLMALKEREAAGRKGERTRDLCGGPSAGEKSCGPGDVPIGCVIVRQGRIISRGYNRRNADKNVLSHAEMISIKKACKLQGDWRLEDCAMYVTLEPCPMCAGAIVQARIPGW